MGVHFAILSVAAGNMSFESDCVVFHRWKFDRGRNNVCMAGFALLERSFGAIGVVQDRSDLAAEVSNPYRARCTSPSVRFVADGDGVLDSLARRQSDNGDWGDIMTWPDVLPSQITVPLLDVEGL